MLSQKTIITFFILIILIFIVCTVFLPRISSCESFDVENEEKQINSSGKDEILKYNMALVDKFDKKEIPFKTLETPSKNITKYQTFYGLSVYPDLAKVNYGIIKNELVDYLKNGNDKWIEWPEYDLWKNKNPESSWKIIPLMSFEKWSEKNTKLFPETTKQLQNINGLVSAGFSKLGPDTTLTLHKGWGNLSNNVLRCHLGLVVPENKCKIFVMGSENEEMVQKEGKWIIFDDSLYHSASNDDKKKDRVVLILDIKRPEYIPKGESDIDNSPELNNFIAEFNKNL